MFHFNRISFFILIILTFLKPLYGQQPYCDTLQNKEVELKSAFKQLFVSKNDSEKFLLNKSIENIFDHILTFQESFFYQFDSLKKIGIIYSPDLTFRIICWDIPLSNGLFRYMCYFQKIPDDHQCPEIYKLYDITTLDTSVNIQKIDIHHWYGALYYSVLANRIQNQTVYTLFGLDMNNDLSNRKIIETMYFSESGSPVFGIPLLFNKKEYKSRLVLEYTKRANISLRFDEHLNMILFDHLAPISPLQAGKYEFYGPDGTFDGFKFVDNKWLFISNVEIWPKAKSKSPESNKQTNNQNKVKQFNLIY